MPQFECESQNLDVARGDELAAGSGATADDAALDAQRNSIEKAFDAAQAKLATFTCKDDCEKGFAITVSDGATKPRGWKVGGPRSKVYFGNASSKWQLDVFCRKPRPRGGRPRFGPQSSIAMLSPSTREAMTALLGRESESAWIATAVEQRIARETVSVKKAAGKPRPRKPPKG